jgi:cytochrome c oxidase assembly factor CtaG
MNLVVSHWSANAAVLAVGLAVVVVHVAGLLGLRADARRGGAALPGGLASEAIAFYSGLLLVVLALVSPLSYYSGRFIWIRVLQDIVLGVYAPPLIVLGAPWLVLWRGLGRTARPRAAASTPGASTTGASTTGASTTGASSTAASPAGEAAPVPPRLRSWPVAVTALFVLVWCGWYVPALYDAGVHHPVVLAAQAVTTMGAGVLFWLQLIGSRPFSPQFGPLYRVMLLVGVIVCGTVLGMVLSFGANVLYPTYVGVGSHHLLSLVFDQQAGGSELWVLVLVPYMIAGIALLNRWLNDEESEALTHGLDRILRPSKSTWPTRTGWR